MQAIPAAVTYFGIVFAAGFLLGTIRTLLLLPRVGETAAVAIELPAMLLISWVACRWTVERFSVPSTAGPRLAMGILAFVLLMTAELALSMAIRSTGVAPATGGARLTIPALMGLAAQFAFACFPWVEARLRVASPR